MWKPALGLAALLSAVAIGYAVGDSSKAPASPEALAPAADAAPDPIPSAAAKSDRTDMASWFDTNEACRGGSVTADSPVCKKRDRIEARLERHKWCWEYSDDRVLPADFQWHRCSIARPAGFKPDPELAEPAPAAVAKPPSLVQQYEAAITPMKDAAVTAMVIGACNFRDDAWVRAVNDRLTDAMYGDPKIAGLQHQLSDAESDQVDAYLHKEMSAHQGFLMGDKGLAGCADLRGLPFISAFDLYAIGAGPLPGG